jgi:uncharacterized membrane protein YhiD involved in acid resistance
MSEEKDINSILEHIQKNVSKGKARSGNDIVSLLKSSNTVLKDIKKINEVSSNKSNVFLKDISRNVENFVSGKSKLFFSGMIKVLNEFYTKQEKKVKLSEEVKPKKEKVNNVKYAESNKPETEAKPVASPKILKYQAEKKEEQKQNKNEMMALFAANANLAKSVFTVQKILLGILQNTSTKTISGTSVTIVPIKDKEEKSSPDELGFRSLVQDVRIIKISLLGLLSSFKTDRLSDTESRREKSFTKTATSVPPLDRNIKNKTDDKSSDTGLFDILGGISSALVGSLGKLGSMVQSGVSGAIGGLGVALKEGLAGIAGLLTGGLISIVRGVGSAIASGALLTILPGIFAGLGIAGIAYMAKKAYDMYTETEQLKKDTTAENHRQLEQLRVYRTKNENDIDEPRDKNAKDEFQITAMEKDRIKRENTQKIKNLTRLIGNSKAKGISLDYEKLEKEKEALQKEIDDAEERYKSSNSTNYNFIREKNKDVLGENPSFLSIEKPRAYGFSEVISGKKDSERMELISGMQQNALNKNITQPIVVSNAPVSNISTSTQETNNLLPMAYRDPSYIQQYKWYGNYGVK